MAKEVELKLSLPSHGVDAFLQDADLGQPQGAPLELDNQYFDTPELALNKAHAALRVRKSQHGFKQTLKIRDKPLPVYMNAVNGNTTFQPRNWIGRYLQMTFN